MIRIKKLAGVWCLTNDREIIEAYDTKYEAEDAYEPYRAKEALETFDRKRNWRSLWDVEHEPAA